MAGLLSINRALLSKVSEKTASALLIPMKDDGSFDLSERFRFQYFPDSIQDTKSINWTPREVPGGSLPIYQWVSSGERIVSFTVYFTTDMDLINNEGGGWELHDRLKNLGQDIRNVDIRSAVGWLRQYMLPTYNNQGSSIDSPVPKAPKRLFLVLPNSGIGFGGGGDSSGADVVPCVMTQCDVTCEAFFPSGLPRIASVGLSFSQIAQLGAGVWMPTSESANLAQQGRVETKTFGYKLGLRAVTVKTP